jgi:hypothetical protein
MSFPETTLSAFGIAATPATNQTITGNLNVGTAILFAQGVNDTTIAPTPGASAYLTLPGSSGTLALLADVDAAVLAAAMNLNLIDLAGASYTSVSSGTTTGSSVNSGPAHLVLTAPTTAVGGVGARIASNGGFGWRRGESANGYDFSADLRIDWRGSHIATDALATFRLTFGKNFSSAIGALAGRGFGVRRVGLGALELIAHNGTSQVTVTSSFTPAAGVAYDGSLRFSAATGGAALWVNGALVASTSAGAVGTGAGLVTPSFWTEVENTGVASVQTQIGIYRPKLLFAS